MFRALTIRAKLIGAFSVLLIVALTRGILGMSGIRGVNHDLDHVNEHSLPGVRWSLTLNAATSEVRATLLRHLLIADEAGKRAVEAGAGGEAERNSAGTQNSRKICFRVARKKEPTKPS